MKRTIIVEIDVPSTALAALLARIGQIRGVKAYTVQAADYDAKRGVS